MVRCGPIYPEGGGARDPGDRQPELHPYTPKDLAAEELKLRQKFTGMITDGDTEDGYATFYCGLKKPTADFPVLLKGVSASE